MFIEVEAKYKIGDIVDWKTPYTTSHGTPGAIILCVITSVDDQVDEDVNFEASYSVCELINGKMTEDSIGGLAYESELTLNKKIKREEVINNLIGEEPKNRMTE